MQAPNDNPVQKVPRNTARDKLVQSAMLFFGERGIGVPMIEIAAAAGNRNKSAITYHFEGRAGLIDAVYDDIRMYLQPRYEPLLQELEATPPRKLSLYDIVLALNAPFFALYASEPGGDAKLKALARLGHESPPGKGTLYAVFLGEVFNRFAQVITLVAPRKPMGQVKFHLAHFLMATVNGLAVTDRWEEADFRSEPDLMFELLLSYTDYVAGGMGGSEFDRPTIDDVRWRRAIQP